MRNVILSMAVSLDGSIARADGDLGWFLTDDGFEVEMLSLLHSVDAMMFGRVAYQLLAEYWPFAGTPASGDAPGGFTSKAREIEFAGLLNSIPKIVFSRTLTKAEWGPATIVRENISREIARMKQEPGKDLVLFAGANIGSTFVNLDLVDEYRLLVHPIVLARGLSLFKNVMEERKLKLLRTKSFDSGVVLLHYARDRAADG